jgi:hypothetical protein
MTTPWHPPFYGALAYIMMAAAALVFARRRAHLDPVDLLLFAMVSALTVMQARGLLWFGLLAPATLGPYLVVPDSCDPQADESEEEAAPEDIPLIMAVVHLVIGVMCVLTPLLFTPLHALGRAAIHAVNTTAPYRGTYGILKGGMPHDLLLSGQAVPDQRFIHGADLGGLITYVAHDESRTHSMCVWVDARIELPPQPVWRELEAILRADPSWSAALDEHEVGRALLAKQGSSAHLVEAMREHASWQMLHESSTHVLFERTP